MLRMIAYDISVTQSVYLSKNFKELIFAVVPCICATAFENIKS